MKRDMDNLKLRDAFGSMPEETRDALMTAARSVKEEEPVKRATIRTVFIAVCVLSLFLYLCDVIFLEIVRLFTL